MRIYQIIFSFFAVIIIIAFYPATPGAVYNQGWKDISPLIRQKDTVISYFNSSGMDEVQKETNTVVHHLNQNRLGMSEYEKAQLELQQFNRPLFGIVGQDSDWISYQEYQKKVLGSSY